MPKLCVIFLILVNVSFANAQQADAYEQAYDLFSAGKYHQALDLFESLLKKTPDDPALIYDIGLCHQYLAHYEQSEFYFSQLLTSPDYEFWVTYQLALNDWRQGFYGAAEIGLTRVVLEANDADLVELATLRYAELLQTMPGVTNSPGAWLGSVSLRRGRDTNIVDAGSLNATDENDGYIDFSTNLAYQWLSPDGNPLWEVQGLLLANRFDEIDSADLTVYALAVDKYFYYHHWQFTLALELERSSSGGTDYLSQQALMFQARSRKNEFNRGWYFSSRAAKANALSSQFNQLAGDSLEATIAYRIPLGDFWYWQVEADWLNDDRDTITTLILQSDLSAKRSGFNTGLGAVLARWSFELGYENRDSHYGELVRLGSNLSLDRDDSRRMWLLRINYDFHEQWAFNAEYIDVDNQSNIPRFTYQQDTLLVGLEFYF